ncbi:monovalent cation/H+ antiporter complex subunit F [Sphingomonas endophytica]|uniref:monovalent cation/H+ antiporter complex subunit F n=1 Tax=Sphingomonas endophytica TaxID=869719 RepID=UPI000B075DA2|nr:monovalent cation/H+ antiporter complex subunit F [Sphingomonas endophytica]
MFTLCFPCHNPRRYSRQSDAGRFSRWSVALDTMVINAIALIVLIGVAGDDDTCFEAALLLRMVGFVGTIACCKLILRGDIVE